LKDTIDINTIINEVRNSFLVQLPSPIASLQQKIKQAALEVSLQKALTGYSAMD